MTYNCSVKSCAVYKPTSNSYLVMPRIPAISTKLLCLPRYRKEKNQASGQGKAISNAINQKKIILFQPKETDLWIFFNQLTEAEASSHRQTQWYTWEPSPSSGSHLITGNNTVYRHKLIKATDVPSNKIATRHKKQKQIIGQICLKKYNTQYRVG